MILLIVSLCVYQHIGLGRGKNMNKTTKYTRENRNSSSNNRNKGRGLPVQKDTTIINAAEFEDNPVREYICNSCNVINYTRLPRTGEEDLICCHCHSIIDIDKAQEISIIEDPNKTIIKPDIISMDYDFEGDVALSKQPEPKGAFAKLREKGLLITNYRKVLDRLEMIDVKKVEYDRKEALIRMKEAVTKAGTYERQAAYQKENCLKTIKYEDKANRISGSMEVADYDCTVKRHNAYPVLQVVIVHTVEANSK
jgi:hypothetical protein